MALLEMNICQDSDQDKKIINMFWNTNAYTTAKLSAEPNSKKILKDVQAETNSLESNVTKSMSVKVSKRKKHD